MSVLDLGGTVDYWLRMPARPKSLHLINFVPRPDDCPDWIRVDMADACAIPDGMLDDRYDLVYSNSVIEHVGGHAKREAFAQQVVAAAPKHWIQTPYRYFPVEPHWVAPFMQFLPTKAAAKLGEVWPLVHGRPSSWEESVTAQLEVELLDITQMRHYYPDSEIAYERAFGLVKSLIAIQD